MPDEIINSEREFQIWQYTVGHRQLLLRSTKSPDFPTRIDVFFKGVSELHLPTAFSGLSIREASDRDIRELCGLLNSQSLAKGVKVFKLQGIDFLGYVAALIVVCHEDEGGYYEPSFFSKNNIL